MGTLIDTSILIAIDRGVFAMQDLFDALPEERWFISAVTVSETLGVLMWRRDGDHSARAA